MMPSKRIHFEDGVGSSEEGEAGEEEEEEEEEPEFLSTEEASDLHFGGMHVRRLQSEGGGPKTRHFKGGSVHLTP